MTLTTPITDGLGNRVSIATTPRCSHYLGTEPARPSSEAVAVKNVPEVAQLVERPVVTREDAGSSPALGAAFMAYSEPG